jgi:hypothetical protein
MNIINIIKEEVSRVLGESNKGYLNEVDWEGDFSDVKKECISPVELADYLNRVRANFGKDTKDREKFGRDEPYLHANSDLFNKGEDIDIDYFINKITQRPDTIITEPNSKLAQTGDKHTHVYKTSVPALRGIVYDKAKDRFFVVNTCPGSGSCALICYALKGLYIVWPGAYDKMTRVLNFLLNEPDEFEKQLYNELKNKCEEHGAHEGYKDIIIVRWNDSGDFFTKRYVKIAESVIERLKKDGYNIDSYAYTKVADVSNDAKFKTTFSTDSRKSELRKVDLDKKKSSIIIPNNLKKGLNLKKFRDEKEYKERVVHHYNLHPKYTKMYDEFMRIEVGDEPIWNVIQSSKDGDDAGFRPDVKQIYQIQH